MYDHHVRLSPQEVISYFFGFYLRVIWSPESFGSIFVYNTEYTLAKISNLKQTLFSSFTRFSSDLNSSSSPCSFRTLPQQIPICTSSPSHGNHEIKLNLETKNSIVRLLLQAVSSVFSSTFDR